MAFEGWFVAVDGRGWKGEEDEGKEEKVYERGRTKGRKGRGKAREEGRRQEEGRRK